jgi:hypothetical protein
MRSKSRGYKKLLKVIKQHATKHWPLWAIALFLFGSLSLGVLFNSQSASAAATNAAGLQLSDIGCGNNLGSAQYVSDLNIWSPWAGDSDNYDPDCVRVRAASTIPKDTDIRVDLQARDINTPCGFLWLFKCGDGGGAIVYGPWVSAGNAAWTGWVTDADAWDPDQYRIILESKPWYGHTIGNFKLGVQVANDTTSDSGTGCDTAGPVTYSASSSAAAWPTSPTWASDGVGVHPSFNCMRINLTSYSYLNAATANLTGTTTAPSGNSVNIPWDVEYINTTNGCTLVGKNSSGTVVDNQGVVTRANGEGYATSIPITYAVTYTLDCDAYNGGADGVDTITITPFGGVPSSLSFKMSPLSVAPNGVSNATISVNNTTPSALSCTLVGKDLSGATDDSGYTYTVPAQSEIVTTYTTTNYGAVDVYLTASPGTNLQWTPPASPANVAWNDANNYVEVIGGGGGGGAQINATNAGGQGGGGGAYSKILNINLTPGVAVNYRIGIGGTNGTNGGDTFFNRTSGAANTCADVSSVCAKGALHGGTGATSCPANGTGCGGQASGGRGTAGYLHSGGDGGAEDCCWGGTGGGGAAGPSGDGGDGGTSGNQGGGGGGGGNGGTRGGDGGSTLGAAGGAGGGNGSSDGGKGADCCTGNNGGNGANGTDFGGSKGPGGGGGAGADNTLPNSSYVPGSGGLYGGGGGGDGDDSVCCNTSDGAQGIIHIHYVPPPTTSGSNSLADNSNVHTSSHTVTQTTNYTVTCTGIPAQTVRVNTTGACILDGVTIPNGGSATFYSIDTPPGPGPGHFCSEYDGLRGCTNGQLTGTVSYKYASCSDQQTVTISANGVSPVTSVRQGSDVAISWDGKNADSCTVTGTDGFNGKSAVTGFTEVAGGADDTVNQKTIYTVRCLKGTHVSTASVTVNILPVFNNQ